MRAAASPGVPVSEVDESTPGPADGTPPEAVHTYRCPVCGHRDGVSFMSAETLRVACSHCGASLELTLRSEEKERVSVQVAKE